MSTIPSSMPLTAEFQDPSSISFGIDDLLTQDYDYQIHIIANNPSLGTKPTIWENALKCVTHGEMQAPYCRIGVYLDVTNSFKFYNYDCKESDIPRFDTIDQLLNSLNLIDIITKASKKRIYAQGHAHAANPFISGDHHDLSERIILVDFAKYICDSVLVSNNQRVHVAFLSCNIDNERQISSYDCDQRTALQIFYDAFLKVNSKTDVRFSTSGASSGLQSSAIATKKQIDDSGSIAVERLSGIEGRSLIERGHNIRTVGGEWKSPNKRSIYYQYDNSYENIVGKITKPILATTDSAIQRKNNLLNLLLNCLANSTLTPELQTKYFSQIANDPSVLTIENVETKLSKEIFDDIFSIANTLEIQQFNVKQAQLDKFEIDHFINKLEKILAKDPECLKIHDGALAALALGKKVLINDSIDLIERLIKNKVLLKYVMDVIEFGSVAGVDSNGLMREILKYDPRDKDGNTPLMKLLKSGQINRLISLGANVHAKNNQGNTALMVAASLGLSANFMNLIRNGARINERNYNGDTAVMLAASKGEENSIQILTAHGADVNLKNKLGSTALMIAAKMGHVSCIEALINNAANVNAKNYAGETAWIIAFREGNTACVNALVKYGANTSSSVLRFLPVTQTISQIPQTTMIKNQPII